jgi:hypothetical protein
MPRKPKQPEPVTAMIAVDPRAAVQRMAELGHDPMAELIRNVRGQGDYCYLPVEQACDALRQFADKIKPTHPQDALKVETLADKIHAALAGTLPVAERNKINLALVEYQHAALKSVEPTKEISNGDVTGIDVNWNLPSDGDAS